MSIMAAVSQQRHFSACSQSHDAGYEALELLVHFIPWGLGHLRSVIGIDQMQYLFVNELIRMIHSVDIAILHSHTDRTGKISF